MTREDEERLAKCRGELAEMKEKIDQQGAPQVVDTIEMAKQAMDKEVPNGSVKVMISYDYCHFEICLGVKDGQTLEEVNELRKDAQRLASEAVRQYKVAKKHYRELLSVDNREYYLARVREIREEIPESEWSPDQKAMFNTLADDDYRRTHPYDYDDDWGEYE